MISLPLYCIFDLGHGGPCNFSVRWDETKISCIQEYAGANPARYNKNFLKKISKRY